MIGDYATKPLQGALFRKFRDQIMGVTPAKDPGPGKTDGGVGKEKKTDGGVGKARKTDSVVGKKETSKTRPGKGKVRNLVPLGKAAPQECVGSRTRDRVEAGPALVTNTMSHQGKTYARAARDGVGNVRKSRSLLHLTSKE
jgi:hypothetical protein